jgi:putative FmdB family regulatory protein
MPTYEYICAKCGHQFEKFQSISEPALTVCPKEICARKRWGKGRVNRAISGGSGLLFKGSGFYITDYRSDSYRQAAKKDAAPTTASTDKPTGSTSAGGSTSSTQKKAAPAKAATS